MANMELPCARWQTMEISGVGPPPMTWTGFDGWMMAMMSLGDRIGHNGRK